MARPLRTFVPEESLHVYNRGNNRMTIFHEDVDYESFLVMTQRSAQRKGVSVHAVVLMTTHFHLLVTPAAEHALGRTMKEIGERYARYYNRKYARTGTLWEGRYRLVPLDDEGQTLICLRYIDQNPVRAKIVNAPDEYRWSSHGLYALGRSWAWLVPHPAFLDLGRSDEERRRAYRTICSEPVPIDALVRVRRR
jgi:REP-associated tyrosine transposase